MSLTASGKMGIGPTPLDKRGGEGMDTERTRKIVELINRLNSEQMDRLERFLKELLGIKDGDERR